MLTWMVKPRPNGRGPHERAPSWESAAFAASCDSALRASSGRGRSAALEMLTWMGKPRPDGRGPHERAPASESQEAAQPPTPTRARSARAFYVIITRDAEPTSALLQGPRRPRPGAGTRDAARGRLHP